MRQHWGLARSLAQRDRVDEGLVGLFDIVEPCLTWFVRGDRAAHRLHLELRPGKCLLHYFYWQHPRFGLMHVRVQSWFPFQVTVCLALPAHAQSRLNGRLWLARQLDQAGIGYMQRVNCFILIEDLVRAQRLAADHQSPSSL